MVPFLIPCFIHHCSTWIFFFCPSKIPIVDVMGADFFRNHHIIATWKTLSAAQSFDQEQYRWLKEPNAIFWDGQSSEPMSSIVTQ